MDGSHSTHTRISPWHEIGESWKNQNNNNLLNSHNITPISSLTLSSWTTVDLHWSVFVQTQKNLVGQQPLGPVTGGQITIFYPFHRGWRRGWDPYFHKLLSHTYSLTPMLTWSEGIKFFTPSLGQLGPERVSISMKMWKFTNQNIAFLKSAPSNYPKTLVFCWSLWWLSNGSHFLGHFWSLIWPGHNHVAITGLQQTSLLFCTNDKHSQHIN
jgi:hypothetical protein